MEQETYEDDTRQRLPFADTESLPQNEDGDAVTSYEQMGTNDELMYQQQQLKYDEEIELKKKIALYYHSMVSFKN